MLSFSTFCGLFPFGRHPQIHTPPPSSPLQAGPRCRGCPAGPALGKHEPPGRPLGGMRVYVRFIPAIYEPALLPPGSPRRRGRGAAQPRTVSILPPPLQLLPAPDLNTSQTQSLCRTANRLEFGAGFPEGVSWRWSLPPLPLPSPGSWQGAGGGAPSGADSARLCLDTGRKTSRGAGKSR